MTSLREFPSTPFRIRSSQFVLFITFTLFSVAGCSSGTSNFSGTAAQAPVVASVSPSSVLAGSPAFTLSLSGSNFQPQAVVNWNASALATTYTSSSKLSATVPTKLLGTASIANITVTNPDGGTSTAGSSSQQVTVANPVPTLSTVTPQSLYAGSPDTKFVFTGTNFNSSSVVMAGSTALSTTYVSATQLTAVAPAALLAAVGSLTLAVSNPAPGGGDSEIFSVTLRQPVATLASLSPSTATVGSPALTVTLTGSYFTPTAVVYINNYSAAATTYTSATSIQFTIPSQDLAYTGNLTITVRDAASQNYPTNSLTFQVVNPVPVLNRISPSTVTAGAPNFTLTLTGSNFVSSSAVLINGTQTQANLYPSATSASVNIPASLVSAVGTVTIAIFNPGPGGGTSATETLNVISADNRLRTVDVEAADLGWDSAHQLLIASTLSGSANDPNSIVAIDPLQGKIVTAEPLPSQPAGISVADDGSCVYVTLPSTGQVERLTLPSLTPDLTFSLGDDSNGTPYTADHVAVAPGEPHTVAITRHSSTTGGGGVVIYDDGVPRPNIAYPTGFDSFYDTLVWGSDASTLYATNSVISTADEDTFSVNSNGVTLLSDRADVLGEFVKHLAFDTKTGHLIDGYGNVVNASTGDSAGQFQLQYALNYAENPFALDSSQRVVFYLNVNGFYPNNSPDGTFIEAFNLDKDNYINSMLVDGLSGASTIVRWGSSGLAMNGSSQIYILDGSFVAPSGISSPVGSYLAPSPTLSSISPAAVTAGSSDVQVTLTGRDFTPASEVFWNNQTLLTDSISDTKIVVTIPASMLTNPVASGMSITNGPGTGSSQSLGFTVLPSLGLQTQMNAIDISGQDLVWDSMRNLIYVAVPAGDTSFPNTIAVVDPTKPGITKVVPVPDGPTALALSDDGQYLYAGFSGQAVVQRYDLPTFSLDLTIPTGAGTSASLVGTHLSCSFPVDVKVAPGSPQTIAVSQGNVNYDPEGCGGLAIYDNATPRTDTLPYLSGDFTRLAWGADADTLYAQSDARVSPQTLYGLSVSPSGVATNGVLNYGSLGYRVHFDAGTKLLYSDSGIITNPVGPAQVGQFSAGGLVVTDSTLNRAFVLSSSGSNNSGQGATSYTLDIFNLNTQALLNSIVIPDVLGYPTQMARWGANGLVFVTKSQSGTTPSLGVLYILQGSSISGIQ